MGSDRDYYADLELSQTADITEIKKQFRKLALKYHPDRNPGREAEVNAQFQIIQSAHEVLGDPQSKAKYDASLPRSKYPGASGVRGNPWSHVGEQFPAPPRRNQGGTRRPAPPPPPPPTGAQRWQSRFASGTAPTAKQSSANDPQLKKNAAKAFEHMRKNPGASGASPTRPRPASSQPPPMPPRTESARQRREASFGNRRTGYQPGDRSGEDEPPVSRHSYQSPAKPPRPPKEPMDATEENAAPMPDPLAQFRDPVSPLDPRPSMPYSRMGGEKTNPSDGTSPARAKSARETGHRPDHSTEDGTASRQNAHRSSSLPRTAGTDRLGDDLDAESGRPRSSELASGYAESSFKSRSNAAHNADAKSADESSSRHHNSSQADGAHKRPSMYATPSKSHKTTMACGNFSMYQTPDPVTSQPHQRRNNTGACFKGSTKPAASSGLHSSPSLSSYELKQYQVLDQLISNAEMLLRGDSQNHNTKNIPTPEKSLDLTRVHSFTIPVDGETFRRTSPEPKPFTRRSTEEIDTSFVDEDDSQSWQFSAGGERPRAQPKRRVQPDGPGSPAKTASPPPSDANQQAPQNAQPDATFNPGGWNDQFGPQTFVPSRDQAASASPTRTNRKKSRKARSGVKGAATAGTAVIIDSSSEDEVGTQWQGRKAPVEGGLDSPQAMDLDSPPAKPMDPPPASHSARNIPVEPTRPEWRQGKVGDTNGEAKPVPPNAEPGLGAMGSEDTEEFRASFSDIRNVAPFAQPASGLKSFDDLKDNLPFESKAATDTPVTLPPVRPLNFPSPPNAPRPPPTAAISGIKPNVTSWSRYLEDFEKYLRAWDDWNATVSDHFRERKRLIRDARANAGYSFLGIRGDMDVVEYYSWVQQDNDVRRRWCTACEEHEQRMREFIAFREKMK